MSMMAEQTVAGAYTASNDPQSNRRWTPRRSCHVTAFVFVTGGYGAIPCTLKDQSSTGALISIDPASVVGDISRAILGSEFWLNIPRDNAQVRCKAIWIEGDRVGVRFTSPVQLLPRTTRSRASVAPNSAPAMFRARR